MSITFPCRIVISNNPSNQADFNDIITCSKSIQNLTLLVVLLQHDGI